MATFSKQLLGSPAYGRMIKIDTTSTPGTIVFVANASAKDEVWLWATNNDTSDRILTIEFGGTTSPDDLITFTVPTKNGLYLIIPGWPLTNSLIVRAFASAANVISVGGYVNRIA